MRIRVEPCADDVIAVPRSLAWGGRRIDIVEMIDQWYGPGSAQLRCLLWLSAAPAIAVVRRAFSMAIAAWAAKFLTNSIWLSVNSRTSWRKMLIARINPPSLIIGAH